MIFFFQVSDDSDEKSPVTSAGGELPDNDLVEDPDYKSSQLDDEQYSDYEEQRSENNSLKTPNEQHNSNPDVHHLEYDMSAKHHLPAEVSREEDASSEESPKKGEKSKNLGEMLRNFLNRT